VEIAADKGIKILGLTDHNSSLNCPAFKKACCIYNIIPIYGMEATTREEVHILCLFTNLEASLAFNDYAYSLLLPFANDPEKTGSQVYVNEDDQIDGEVEYYLVNPLELSIGTIGVKVAEYGGIVIPAHVDRPAYSMTSQLGQVASGPWEALECVNLPPLTVMSTPLNTLGYPLITSSDAHYPQHIGRRVFELEISAEDLQPGGPGTDADFEAFCSSLRKCPRR